MKTLSVKKIKEGTVIDHIPSGKAPFIQNLLGTGKEETVLLAMNVPSGKYGKKDILKIEGKTLSKKELEKLAFVSKNITVNIIEDSEVSEKFEVPLPKILENVVPCPNPKCITNFEKIDTKFIPVSSGFRCFYCERTFKKEEFQAE